jgi:hypothetical protein
MNDRDVKTSFLIKFLKIERHFGTARFIPSSHDTMETVQPLSCFELSNWYVDEEELNDGFSLWQKPESPRDFHIAGASALNVHWLSILRFYNPRHVIFSGSLFLAIHQLFKTSIVISIGFVQLPWRIRVIDGFSTLP